MVERERTDMNETKRSELSQLPDSVPYDEESFEHNFLGSVPEYEHWEDGQVCHRCGGDGFIEYNEGDGGDWGEDSPSRENHLIECRHCGGTGEI